MSSNKTLWVTEAAEWAVVSRLFGGRWAVIASREASSSALASTMASVGGDMIAFIMN
jgi:hypothetical protein